MFKLLANIHNEVGIDGFALACICAFQLRKGHREH